MSNCMLPALGRRRFHRGPWFNTAVPAPPLTSKRETFAAPATNLEEKIDRHGMNGAVDDLPPVRKKAIELLREMSLKEAC